jgi:hypothetical protein
VGQQGAEQAPVLQAAFPLPQQQPLQQLQSLHSQSWLLSLQHGAVPLHDCGSQQQEPLSEKDTS